MKKCTPKEFKTIFPFFFKTSFFYSFASRTDKIPEVKCQSLTNFNSFIFQPIQKVLVSALSSLHSWPDFSSLSPCHSHSSLASRSQFHQHFTSSFFAYILLTKNYKPKQWGEKSFRKHFYIKKLLGKYWWNWLKFSIL